MNIEKIPTDQIVSDPYSPPKALMENIKKYGISHPLLVLQCNNASYKVIAGRKRLAAAKEAGLTEVPAIVFNSHAIYETLSLSENYHRSPSPALEAEMMKRLMDSGVTQEEVASLVGISQAQVCQRLKLLKLIPEFFEKLKRGELRPSIAEELCSLDQETQRTLLDEEKLTLALVRGIKTFAERQDWRG